MIIRNGLPELSNINGNCVSLVSLWYQVQSRLTYDLDKMAQKQMISPEPIWRTFFTPVNNYQFRGFLCSQQHYFSLMSITVINLNMGKNKPQYYAVSKGSIMSNGLSFGIVWCIRRCTIYGVLHGSHLQTDLCDVTSCRLQPRVSIA